jgi:hypothetical protein
VRVHRLNVRQVDGLVQQHLVERHREPTVNVVSVKDGNAWTRWGTVKTFPYNMKNKLKQTEIKFLLLLRFSIIKDSQGISEWPHAWLKDLSTAIHMFISNGAPNCENSKLPNPFLQLNTGKYIPRRSLTVKFLSTLH